VLWNPAFVVPWTILVSGHFPAYSMTDNLDKAIPIRQNKTSYKKMGRKIYAPFVVLYLVARQPYCTRHSLDVADLDWALNLSKGISPKQVTVWCFRNGAKRKK
jgi:hypothetical protein